MRIGVAFPTVEIGHDLGAVRSFVQAAEDLGYDHIRILDHVLGADPQYHPEVDYFAYTHESVTHEPFTLMAYLAAFTQRVDLMTGIIILPQRQTALVAKQAAEVDVLSGGRLKLGIGIGWNPVEYEALGEDFHVRGRKSEEQIEVLRALWTQEVVSYKGQWHTITHAGINPLPVQRPIPIWIGTGRSIQPVAPDRALRRIGRLADGWFNRLSPGTGAAQLAARIHTYTQEAGRDPARLEMGGSLTLQATDPEPWIMEAKEWKEIGASHLTLGFRNGPASVDYYIDSLKQFKDRYPEKA